MEVKTAIKEGVLKAKGMAEKTLSEMNFHISANNPRKALMCFFEMGGDLKELEPMFMEWAQEMRKILVDGIGEMNAEISNL